MNDGLLFDAFPFVPFDPLGWGFEDLPVLAGYIPPLDDPLHPLHPAYPLGPTGGGFPRFWENIDDIFSGPLDLIFKIAGGFKETWSTIWQGIGGGIRWSYNMLDAAVSFVRTNLGTVIGNVGNTVVYSFDWVWRYASDPARLFAGGIAGGLGWVRSGLASAITGVGNTVTSSFDWLWKYARDPLGRFTGGVAGGLGTVWSSVITTARGVLDKVEDTGGWLWNLARDPLGLFTGGIAGGIGSVWSTVVTKGRDILGKVEDTGDWLWKYASDPLGTFTGGLSGGFHFVTDTVIPEVLGLGIDILGGITGGFDKLGDILMKPLEFLADRILDAIKWPFEAAFKPVADTIVRKFDIIRKLSTGHYAYDEFLDDIMDPPIVDNVVTGISYLFAGVVSMVASMMPIYRPAVNLMIQEAERDRFHSRLLVEGNVLEARHRDIDIAHGYEDHLARWGYSEQDIAALFALSERLPSPADLVRFGVREVFTPEIAERFGQFDDFPSAFPIEMARQGYTQQSSLNYWAAHWDLPSVSQGFEMLHRGVIDESDVRLLLRALDVMPFWREKLIQISYHPIARVDLRRLYQKGVITEAELEAGYRALGYNAENARRLTDWTKIAYPRAGEGPSEDLRALTVSIIKQAYVRRLIDRSETLDKLLALEYSEEDADLTIAIWDFDLEWNPSLRFEVPFKDLSRSTITDAYRRGVFDFNRAVIELVEAGYTQDDAELLLQLEDLKLQQELSDMEVDLVLQDARAGTITLAEAETRLLGLGLEPVRVTFYIRREELRRMTKTRTLTVSQISRAYAAGIFTEAQFLERVEALGYTTDDTAVLIGLEGKVDAAKRQLGRSEVEKLLRRQEISVDDALVRLTAMGYLSEDAQLIVGSVQRQLERGLVERLLEQALLTRTEALDRLVKAGFASADAELIVKSVEQKMAEEAAVPAPEETPSRELSRTLVERFLREGLLDRQQALERLVKAGFTTGDAELIVLSVERKLAEEAAQA